MSPEEEEEEEEEEEKLQDEKLQKAETLTTRRMNLFLGNIYFPICRSTGQCSLHRNRHSGIDEGQTLVITL